MSALPEIDPDQSIDDIMRAWPQTIAVILGHAMHCVGCPLASFHTPVDAAIEHSVDIEDFLNALNQALHEKSAITAE
jgi:hybrid cluster-associated redox disulfide protein